MKALVLNSTVIDVAPSEFTVANNPDLQWVNCDETVKIGWHYENSTFSHPYANTDAIAVLRSIRDQKLSSSDWRMVSDYPGSNQTEWQTYRQALRDITTQTPSLDSDGNLTGITWPTPPND